MMLDSARSIRWGAIALFTLTLGLAACGGDDEIEVVGTWTSSFDDTETITADKWGTAAIVEFDNDANYAVTQNPSDAEFGASLFNRLEWTDIEADAFYYCFVDFSRPTAEAARTSTKTADASDPSNSGCGGFSWTKLSK